MTVPDRIERLRKFIAAERAMRVRVLHGKLREQKIKSCDTAMEDLNTIAGALPKQGEMEL